MRKLVLTFLTSGVLVTVGHAQALFTYGSNSVAKDDFLRVYKKNSLNKQPDMSDTALRSYLDLYALFRMKVAEADKQRLDTLPSIDRELDNYRKQLAKNYLTDDQVVNKMIHEAYDRMKFNVHVEHILVNAQPGSDTVQAYRKIDSLYQLVSKKPSEFEAIAKAASDDKGSRDNGGDLGYFTALQVIYPFENAAYNTPVGKISKPFRTQFGYHIVKVLDKRADRGTVKVAQVMIYATKSKGADALAAAKKRADSVYAMAKAGTPFADLVAKYSDDHFSKNDSGVLKPFGAGKMVPAFEDAAFGLKKPGDIAAPVQTEYGYHVIKLISKTTLAPYDTLYSQLKHKVENDSRAQTAREYYFAKVKEKNGFKENEANVKEIEDALTNIPDTGKNARMLRGDDFRGYNKVIFTLGGKNYSQNDFAKYMETLTHGRINGPHAAIVKDGYNMYVNTVVNDFQEHKLVEENPEFKRLMAEYRDGIMLFELMDRNVWSKASKDTNGLKAFFEPRKSRYQWEPGFEGAVYKFKNKAAFDTGLAMIRANKYTEEEIAKAINTDANPDGVTVQRGRYEFARFKDATLADLQANKVKVINPENGPYEIVVAKQVYAEKGQKSLDEARGYVVAEYQDYLEKQWNEKMRREYPVKVNEQVFQGMVSKKK